jgi:hypothetical protein
MSANVDKIIKKKNKISITTILIDSLKCLRAFNTAK